MEKEKKRTNEYYVIDVGHVMKTVWQKAWLVMIVGVLAAAIGFSMAAFGIAPTYSSSIMLYVNNSSFNMGDLGFSITSSELSAAQSLAKTYTVLLKNRTTLERVVEATGLEYSWKDLYGMIEAAPVNETEIMGVTVTCKSPYDAEKIANGIAEVLPQRISEVIEGASMEVVDSAVVNTQKVAPSITQYTAIGLILGALLAVAILIIVALRDDTIHDEEYVMNTYEYPILAKVPNLLDVGAKKYSYYQQKKTKS